MYLQILKICHDVHIKCILIKKERAYTTVLQTNTHTNLTFKYTKHARGHPVEFFE